MLSGMGDDAIIRRSDAHARGVTDGEIRRLVRSGTWMRLAAGVYLPTAVYSAACARGRHRFRAAAALANAQGDSALSHVSAAVVHDLELWRVPFDDVHLTRNRAGGSCNRPGRVLHSARFGPDDVVDVCGVRALSVARTVVDLAATVSFEQAVVTGDAALRRGSLTFDDLGDVVERMGRHPGRAKAARAVKFMSDRSESVGESRSRVLMVREQLPVPLAQAEVFDVFDRRIGRVDFLLPEHGVIGEFDGRIKYRRDGVADADAEEVVFREKLREDRLRHAGWVVVRWIWDDLNTPGALVARIREGIALAARGPGPVGHYEINPLTKPGG